jgi:hypothetical protein
MKKLGANILVAKSLDFSSKYDVSCMLCTKYMSNKFSWTLIMSAYLTTMPFNQAKKTIQVVRMLTFVIRMQLATLIVARLKGNLLINRLRWGSN